MSPSLHLHHTPQPFPPSLTYFFPTPSYAICEGTVKDQCDALKEAAPLPECPCLAGATTPFFFSISNFSPPTPETPSLSILAPLKPTPGGQWTFDGEPQSYCQKPIGRAKWFGLLCYSVNPAFPRCPTSNPTVTKAGMGAVDVKYCEGR